MPFLYAWKVKEVTFQEMVDFCSEHNIIVQPVFVNHTMQCRVEGAVGYSKQHTCVALVCANAPDRFWPDTTVDFTCKK